MTYPTGRMSNMKRSVGLPRAGCQERSPRRPRAAVQARHGDDSAVWFGRCGAWSDARDSRGALGGTARFVRGGGPQL